MNSILAIFQFPFVQRALVAGIFLALLLAILGVFVVLRRMSFLADGIAHASLAGVAFGLLTGIYPLATALLVGILFALMIYVLEKKTELSLDSIINLIFTAGLAIGVVLLSFKSTYQPDLMSFLFGNILAISANELKFMLVLGSAAGLFLILNYKSLVILVINQEKAYLAGLKVRWLQLIFYVLTAVITILGIKILGVILVGALLVIPVSIAKLWARSFKSLVIASILAAEIIFILGISLSILLNLPTGAVIVLVGILIFILTMLLTGGKK